MPFLWLGVDDEPGPESDRAAIEAGSIALLSCLANPLADPPSESWLGRLSDRPAVVGSGLWNVNHVAGPEVPGLIPAVEHWIAGS